MKKKTIGVLVPFFMTLMLLTGCQNAPEVSDDEDILRAKGSSEDTVEEIVNGEEEEAEGEVTALCDTEKVSAVLGNGGSRMKIEAEVAPVPEAVRVLTMQADSSLNEEALQSFLDPQGEVRDFTEELLAQEEAERQRVAEIDKKLGEGSSMVEIAGAGDGSCLALTDGNRRAVLYGKTGGSYEDAGLLEKCLAAAKGESRELDVKDPNAGDPTFSLQDAKEILVRKLSSLGIEDVHLSTAYIYEQGSFPFYEVQFSPVVNGIPIAHSFGQQDITRVYPNGTAWVCAEGAADIGLWNCCMGETSGAKEVGILSFSKILDLLEIYLDDGRLQCVEDVPFSTAELVYYAELEDGKLELMPMWNIHMDLGAYVDYCGQSGRMDSAWTIYIDAVTGELAEVQ